MDAQTRGFDPVRWAKVKAVFTALIAATIAVLLAATWVNRHTDPEGALDLGAYRPILSEAYQRPVAVFDAPHVAIVVVANQGSGRNWDTVGNGQVSFGDEALVALDRRARHDGALVVWCPETDRWEHPDGQHTYLRGGERVSGPDLRHLGRLLLELDGTALSVQPGRRIEAGPLSSADDWLARPPACV